LAEYVACVGGKKKAYQALVGKPEAKKPLLRHKGGRIILKWTLEKQDGMV
jgi:hypothetical protein